MMKRKAPAKNDAMVGSFFFYLFLMSAGALTTSILPIYAIQMGASVTSIGPIWSLASISGFAMAILWSSFSDRKGKRLLYVVIGTAAQSLTYVLQAFTTNIYDFTAVYVLRSILGAGTVPIFYAFVSESIEGTKRGRSMGTLFMGASVGGGITISSAGFIAEQFGIRTVFCISSVLALLALGVLRKFLWRIPSRENSDAKDEETKRNLLVEIKSLRSLGSSFMIFWATAICQGISSVVKLSYVVLFFEQQLALSQSLSTLFLSFAIWVEIPTLVFFGLLSDSIGRKPIMLVGLFTVSMANITLSLSQNHIHAGLAMVLHGISWGSFGSASSALVAELVDSRNRAKAMSFYSSANAVAGVVAPSIMSFSILETGFRSAFLVIALIVAIGFFLTLLGMHETARRT